MSNTHVNTGIRKILEMPFVYNLFHKLTGGNAFRKVYFDKYFALAPGSRVLDIGCGSGVMLENISEDIEYTGVDFEPGYISYCQNKYGNRGQFLLEKVGGSVKQEWVGHFDAMNAHGLFHHLADQDIETVLEGAFRYLKPGGYLVSFDTCYFNGQGALSKWLVSKDRGQNVKYPKAYLALAEKYFSNIESELYTNYHRLPYAAFAMKMTK